MIVHEELPPDPVIDACRLAVLEACACSHPVFCYSTIDALEYFLEETILKPMLALRESDPNTPHGLTDVILLFRNPRAVTAIATRMEPGFDYWALHLPDGWPILYSRIGELRQRARRYDPAFVSKYR